MKKFHSSMDLLIKKRFFFKQDQLVNSPSRRFCVSEVKELFYRQQSAHFIYDLGQQLNLNLLCINNAIVYMHRFYMFHSFTEINWSGLATAAIFLAAKSEEQARKIEYVIKCACYLLQVKESLDVASEFYKIKEQELVACETILISTLGFDFFVEHPHLYVIKICEMVKAGKDLGSMSYLLATTSLQLTTMCLMYRPQTVACVCFYLACKWTQWKIDPCSKGKDWLHYADPSMTHEKLEDLANKYLEFLEAAPVKFKKRLLEKKAAIDGPFTSKIKAESAKQDSPLPEKKEQRVPETIPVASLQSELPPHTSTAQLSALPSEADAISTSVSHSSSERRINVIKEDISFAKAFHLRRRENRKNQNPIPKNTSYTHQDKTQLGTPHKFNENLAQKSDSLDGSCSVVVTESSTNVQDKQAFPITGLNHSCIEHRLPTNDLELKYPVGPVEQGIFLPYKEKTETNGKVLASSSTQFSMPQLKSLHTEKLTKSFTSDSQKFLSKEFKAMKSLQHALLQRKEQFAASVKNPVSSLTKTSPLQLLTKPLIVNSHDKCETSRIKPCYVSQNMVFPIKEGLVGTEKVVSVPRSAMPEIPPSTSKQTVLSMPLMSDLEDLVKAKESFQNDKNGSNHHQNSKGLQVSTSKKYAHVFKSNPDNLSTLTKVPQQMNSPLNVPVLPVQIKMCKPVKLCSDKSRTGQIQQLKNDPKIIKNVLPTLVLNSMSINQQPCKGSNPAMLESNKQEKITHMVQSRKLEAPNIYQNISGLKVKIPKELVTLKKIVTKPNKIPEISSTANILSKENKMKSSEVLKIIATDKSGTYIMAAKGNSDKVSRKRLHSDFELNKNSYDKHSTKLQKLDHSSSKVQLFQQNITQSNVSLM